MDKYYTPEISDLYVGYECEVDENIYADKLPHWISVVVSENNIGGDDGLIAKCRTHKIRTPYLTKEQIETEGWEVMWATNVETGFSKNRYRLLWSSPYQHNYIKVYDVKDYEFFSIRVPLVEHYSINEFRKIMKWLGI